MMETLLFLEFLALFAAFAVVYTRRGWGSAMTVLTVGLGLLSIFLPGEDFSMRLRIFGIEYTVLVPWNVIRICGFLGGIAAAEWIRRRRSET
ncbi:MAG: hypothetical protein QW445_03430 [Candidatus Bathyarchaeia archaeon]